MVDYNNAMNDALKYIQVSNKRYTGVLPQSEVRRIVEKAVNRGFIAGKVGHERKRDEAIKEALAVHFAAKDEMAEIKAKYTRSGEKYSQEDRDRVNYLAGLTSGMMNKLKPLVAKEIRRVELRKYKQK